MCRSNILTQDFKKSTLYLKRWITILKYCIWSFWSDESWKSLPILTCFSDRVVFYHLLMMILNYLSFKFYQLSRDWAYFFNQYQLQMFLLAFFNSLRKLNIKVPDTMNRSNIASYVTSLKTKISLILFRDKTHINNKLIFILSYLFILAWIHS